MFFATKRYHYPGVWKKRFAIIPKVIAEEQDKKIWVWLEWYEKRQLDDMITERRALGGNEYEPYKFVPLFFW